MIKSFVLFAPELPPGKTELCGPTIADFKQGYLDKAVDYMKADIEDVQGNVRKGTTVKKSFIPDDEIAVILERP